MSTSASPRVLVRPFFNGEDQGDGGIRRVVEAQERYLPQYDIEVVRDIARADLVAVHAGEYLTTDLPFVEHCHGLYWAEYDWEYNWFYALNKQVIDSMLRADCVTAPSNWVANIIRRGAWISPSVLYHGIESDDWKFQKKNAGYILWNKTRIDPICDPEPVNTLARRNPYYKFATTFGDKRDNVVVLGNQPYELAKQVVQNAQLYLCTTRETFGIGTLEAMASGVPIIGWAWGGQREFIVNGEHGWLATPGDYEGLEYGISYCIEHRDRLAQNCRDLVLDKFTWPTVMEQYANLYRNVLAERKIARPKVSVVITNYKLEPYLKAAVLSALEQEAFKNYEIVVVNDCSPTWDMELEEWLKENDVVVVHNEKNLYLAGSLNEGIKASSGEYILCLDADNLIAPRTLAVLATSLDKDKTIDIAYGAMEVIESSDWNGISGWPGEFNYRAQITHHNQIPSTCMYRRRVWERSGGYRERCRTAEDADFWCRATSLGFKPQKVTDAVTLIYRDRNDSMSRTERDWNWHDWYTWNRDPKLTPFVVQQQTAREIKIPTYEPVRISVVIPCGPGHERIVIDAVDSLVAQTLVQWECIVVNDTGRELPWIHPFVKVIDSDGLGVINKVSRARNLGIVAAQSKFFVLLDADDYLQPTALQRMYEAITSNKLDSNTAYAYTDWYVAETKEKYKTPEYSCETIFQRFSHAVTCIYKKEAWKKVGGFDESLHGWEDWDFVISLNAAGYCGVRVPYPLLQYRLGSGKRREELYAKLEDNKKEIANKWREYISGEKKMPCGCQQNSSLPTRQQGDGAFRPDPNGDMLQLEYAGEHAGPLTYTGKVTGNQYRFGTDPEHSVKYVFKEDVPALLTIEGFKYYDESNNEPILEALGPPARELNEELIGAGTGAAV